MSCMVVHGRAGRAWSRLVVLGRGWTWLVLLGRAWSFSHKDG